MRPQTKELKEQLLHLEDAQDRLNVLKDQYKGETAYVIAAGPSLNNYSHEFLKEFMKDKLCMPIKQTYKVFKDVADFHLLNFCNFSPYDWSNNKSIVTWIIFEQFHPQMIFQNNLNVDLMIPIVRNNHLTGGAMGNDPNKLAYSLCEKLDWDHMRLDDPEYGINQPWGPGIMYEAAIPLAMYLGCKKIVTVGWDIGDLNSFENDLSDESQRVTQEHFYGSEGKNKIVYAPQKMGPREILSVSKSSESLYYWLKEKEIDWEIVSDRNPSYKGIPRTELK